MSKPKYDSSVARMAGNIASGLAAVWFRYEDEWGPEREAVFTRRCVRLARAIVAEVKRTEPVEEQ